METAKEFFMSEHDFAWEQIGTATDYIESVVANAYDNAIDRLASQYEMLGTGFKTWLYTEKQVAEQDLLTAKSEEEQLEKETYLNAVNRCWYELYSCSTKEQQCPEEVPF